MHKLVRRVRFSVNPFRQSTNSGYNSYASKPPGEGLSIFLELSVGLVGQAELATGFVINVSEVDEAVRQHAVPLLSDRIRQFFCHGRGVGLLHLCEWLGDVRKSIADKFGKAMLVELALSLNPYRKIAFDCEDMKMFYFSEKFDFAAMHKLWNEDFSEQENFKLFGKCANPAGHGHNYVVEVTIKAASGDDICIGDFEKVVDGELIRLVDHKNLNADVAEFAKSNPTIENIAAFAWDRLAGRFGQAKLHCITVAESDRTCCSYYG